MLEKLLVIVNNMLSIKNKILLGISLAIIFIIATFFYTITREGENIEIEKVLPNKKATSTQYLSDGNKTGRTMKISEPLTEDICDLKNEEEKQKCLNQIIVNESRIEENLKKCLEVDDYELRTKCIFQGVKNFYSVRSCSRIPDHKFSELCIQQASIETRYSDFCEAFNGEPHEKQECQDRTEAFKIKDSGDIDKCGDLETLEYAGLCRIMTNETSGKGCEDIVDRKNRDICISEAMFFLADTKDKCQKIPSINYKKVCLDIFENREDPNYKFDTDNDGLTHFQELWLNTNPFNPDTDGDGLTDYEEIIEKKGGNPLDADTDGDGLSDYDEVQLGTSVQRPDTDGDGVLDSADSDPLSGDSDNDRLTDTEEALWGTDPHSRDTDGDGISDYDEVKNGKNPLGEGWKSDTDGDGLIDIDEIFYLTDPLKSDTDGDGVNDYDEIEAGTNPIGVGDFDFDGDRLSDKEEEKLGTNKYKSDTNNDGITDYESIKKSLDPVSKDTDGDGLNNIYEIKNGLDPIKSDTDGDGLSDGDELNKYFTDPNNLDTDRDGFLDGEEVQAGFDPRSVSI